MALQDPSTILHKPLKPNCPPPDEVFKGSMVAYYNSSSYRDDLAWAAAWMYRATGDGAYLNDAYTFWTEHVTQVIGEDLDGGLTTSSPDFQILRSRICS